MVLGLSAALAKQGIEVTIITTNTNGDTGQIPLDVPLGKPIKQHGYEILYFPCFPFRRYKFSLDLLYWLNHHATEFDIVHLHALFSPVITAAAKVVKYKNLPYILRPLGTLDPADLQKKKLLKTIYTAILERDNIANAAAIHFTTQQEANISDKFGISTRDLVIPVGVNKLETNFKNHPTKSPVVNLLFMSRIDPKKGLDLLLPALEKLLAEGVNFKFILAGGNPQLPEYEKKICLQIAASPLAKNTTITGFVTGEAKAALLQDADLFVLPSYYENFGIAVAEAMAAGVAVVISDKVYIWEEVKQAKAGWVCSLNVDSLTDTLRKALENDEERQKRGVNGREYAEKNYSWEAIACQTIQAYEKILKNHV